MTPEQHQIERIKMWREAYFFAFRENLSSGQSGNVADAALSEFDARFPAPPAKEKPPFVSEIFTAYAPKPQEPAQ